MPRKLTADQLMDEILIATVLRKEWNFKRIAEFTVEKQIELLQDILRKEEIPTVRERLRDLQTLHQDIQATKV